MLNHARTLLMNTAGGSTREGDLADELIDPSFYPLTLPGELQAIRNVLFGMTPDKSMLNYRTRQLLCLAHATPLESYITKLDNRITYQTAFTSFAPTTWEPVVVRAYGAGTLTVTGRPEAPDRTGVMKHEYLVQTPAMSDVSVHRVTAPISENLTTFTTLSRIPLDQTPMTFKLSSLDEGQSFRVTAYAEPAYDLSTLATLLSSLGEPTYNFLFGISDAEPYTTFGELFFRKQELPLRLSAIVLALIYRTNELRS